MFCKVDNFFRNTQIDFFPIKIIKIWRVIKKTRQILKREILSQRSSTPMLV